MSKHTPGPWRAIAQTNAAWEIAGPERKGYAEGLVCRVTLNEANARLIAASPDLLEALEMLWREYKALADSGDAGFWSAEDTPEGMVALAAIAKATGE